nr:hypothetical protein [Tanacetum cinerariifolium]
TPVEPTDLQRTKAEQLKIVLKRSRRETHISQQSGSGIGEGTGSKPGVPEVPSDDSEEELSWKSSDDEEVGSHEEGKESDESNDASNEGSDNDSDETVKSGAGKDGDDDDDEDDDDDDEEEELTKDDEEDITQNVEDTHVTLTPVNPDGPQESSSMLSFLSSMLNPLNDVGVKSIFTTTSSPIVSLE